MKIPAKTLYPKLRSSYLILYLFSTLLFESGGKRSCRRAGSRRREISGANPSGMD
jgi:hypothetical protein